MKNYLIAILILLAFTTLSCNNSGSNKKQKFAAGVNLQGTTFFIDPAGSDATGSGSYSAPWKTLKKATTAVTTPGDIIHVNAGNYTETQSIQLLPGVNIEGDGAETTVINSTVTGNWSVFLELISNQPTNDQQVISGVTFNGGYVSESNFKTWWGIQVTRRSNVTIQNCKITGFYDRGVIFDGNGVQNPLTDPGVYATGNKFFNNIVTNTARVSNGALPSGFRYGAGQLNIGGQLGMEIFGNLMIQDQRPNFKNGWPIKYWENGWLKGCKIYHNTLVKAPNKTTYPGENDDWDFAIELFNISGLEIYKNKIQGSIDLNYNYKGNYPFSVWIHHDTLLHSNPNFAESGIILEFATQSAIIEDNIITNASTGIQFNTRGPGNSGGYNYPAPTGGYSALTGNIIRRNLITGIYRGNGFGVGVISEGTDDPFIDGMTITNNTIMTNQANAPWWGLDFTSQPNGSAKNMVISNNIVMGFNAAWLGGTNGSTNINGLKLQNNLTWANANGNLPLWPAGNPQNYTNTGNIQADPKLTVSFTPGAGSPAIGSGTDGTDIGWTGGVGGGGGSNQPPVANAGLPQTITLPTNSATLRGTGTDDGTIASIAWIQISGPGTAVIANASQLTATVTGLLQGSYAFQLTITDNDGLSDKDTAIIQVNPPAQQNTAPVVNAGSDETITIILSLKGSATDEQNNITKYKWTKVSGPYGAVITNPNVPATTVTGVKPGTYIYRLTVTDALGLKNNDTVTFIIK